jgi:hypothetical protein
MEKQATYLFMYLFNHVALVSMQTFVGTSVVHEGCLLNTRRPALSFFLSFAFSLIVHVSFAFWVAT